MPTLQLKIVDDIGTSGSPGGLRGIAGSNDGDLAQASGFWAPNDGGGGLFRWESGVSDDDGGTIIPGSSGGAWRRLSIAEDAIFNVKYFGAKGDYTTTDDTVAIRKAIAAIEALQDAGIYSGYPGSGEGAVLFFPRGWYKVTDTLTIRRGMVIRGAVENERGGDVLLNFVKIGDDDFDGIRILTHYAYGTVQFSRPGHAAGAGVIPKGTQLSNGSQNYYTEATVSFGATEDGPKTVAVISQGQEAGDADTAANTVTTIVSSLWDATITVNNSTAIEVDSNDMAFSAKIENISFYGPYAPAWPDWTDEELDASLVLGHTTFPTVNVPLVPFGSGIVIRAGNVRITNSKIDGWQFDAVNVESTESNCNDLIVERLFISNCGRNGLFMAGGNSQVGTITGLYAVGTGGGYAIYDRTSVGSTYVGCHSEGYGKSYFTSELNPSTFIGCYSEEVGGAKLGRQTLVVGGTYSAGGIVPNDVILPGRIGVHDVVGMAMTSIVSDTWTYFPAQTFASSPVTLNGVYTLNYVDASSNNMVVNLIDPATPGNEGVIRQLQIFKRVDDTNYYALIEVGFGSGTIDGRSSIYLRRKGEAIALIATDEEYKVLWHHLPETDLIWSPVDFCYRTLSPAATSGAYTVGTRFRVQKEQAIMGVRINYPDSTSRSVKVSVWDSAGSQQLTRTVTLATAGPQYIEFTSPWWIPNTQHYKILTCGVYLTAGTHYLRGGTGNADSVGIPGATGASMPPQFFGGKALYWQDLRAYHSGDAMPDTTDANDWYAIEPVFADP